MGRSEKGRGKGRKEGKKEGKRRKEGTRKK